MTRTQRALVVLIPLAVASIVFIQYTWMLWAFIGVLAVLIAIAYFVLTPVVMWVIYGEWHVSHRKWEEYDRLHYREI